MLCDLDSLYISIPSSRAEYFMCQFRGVIVAIIKIRFEFRIEFREFRISTCSDSTTRTKNIRNVKCQLSKQFSFFNFECHTRWRLMSVKLYYATPMSTFWANRAIKFCLLNVFSFYFQVPSRVVVVELIVMAQTEFSTTSKSFHSNSTHLAAAVVMSWHCYVEIKSSKFTNITIIHFVPNEEIRWRRKFKSFLMLIDEWNYEETKMMLFFNWNLNLKFLLMKTRRWEMTTMTKWSLRNVTKTTKEFSVFPLLTCSDALDF